MRCTKLQKTAFRAGFTPRWCVLGPAMTPRLIPVPIRVLLVDDVVEVRRLVRTSLRFRGGFEVVGEAADGAEAVRLASQLRPDVVVLDLGLPDIAGRDLLTRVRAAAPSAKIVVSSGLERADRAWIADHAAAMVHDDADLGYLVELLESVASPFQSQAV